MKLQILEFLQKAAFISLFYLQSIETALATLGTSLTKQVYMLFNALDFGALYGRFQKRQKREHKLKTLEHEENIKLPI